MLALPEKTNYSWLGPGTYFRARERKFASISILFLLFVFAVDSGFGVTRRSAAPQLSVQQALEAEQLLWDLGYWAGPVDGKFDSASRHALIAFQKVEGRARTGKLTDAELVALQSADRPQARFATHAHIEIDLKRQVLFVVDSNGAVTRVLPVSTGNGKRYIDHGEVHHANTPRGTFKVFHKVNGWRISTLGGLYYPNYFLSGFAVHGSLSIPTTPASHGCIRVPMFAAKELSRLMPLGTEVVLYD